MAIRDPAQDIALFAFYIYVLTDLAVGLISVSTDIGWRITVAWLAGNVLCKIIRFLQTVVTFSSTYVLVALSIDRYDAITHPMNFSGSCEYKQQSCLQFPRIRFVISGWSNICLIMNAFIQLGYFLCINSIENGDKAQNARSSKLFLINPHSLL